MSEANIGYVARKIAHMRRIGVIVRKDGGFGQNGGAAPDWLVDQQKDERERIAKYRMRNQPSALQSIAQRYAALVTKAAE